MAFHKLKGKYTYKRTNPNYTIIQYPEHPMAWQNGFLYLHRVVMENKLGRYLEPGEIVHHRDGNKYNNDISNLKLTTNKAHSKHHAIKRGGTARTPRCCLVCNVLYKPHNGNQQYCSGECSAIAQRRCARPSKTKLQKLIWKYPTQVISKHYGVSDKAVEKWCKKYGIDKPSRGYWLHLEAKQKDENKPTKNRLKKLINKYPLVRIAEKCNVGLGTVKRWCQEYGLKGKPSGYWRKVETGHA